MCLLQLIKPTTEIVESSNTQDLPNLFDHGTLEWGEHGEFFYPQGSWNQFPVDTESILRFQNFPQNGQLQSKREMHKLLHTKLTNNKALLNRIGNYIQYSSINHNVKNMHIYVSESLCCIPETNTTL